jgi:hypothetical protein
VVTALWIIYGAAIALRMAVFTQTAISWQEGLLWFVAAVLLSALAYFKESSDRKGSNLAITGLREQLIKLQGFSEGTASAMGRSLNRMEQLPETTPKSEEIVSELRDGLKELRDSARALTESTARPQTAPVTLTRLQSMFLRGFVSVGIVTAVLIVVLTIKTTYLEFPNPLSPAQMSDLADRLRADGPQKVMIVRTADHKSVALAEQFKQIFDSAHWVLVTPPRLPHSGAHLFRGLVVWRSPADYQPLSFSRALYISNLPYETQTDIELTNAGYFILTISDNWVQPTRP